MQNEIDRIIQKDIYAIVNELKRVTSASRAHKLVGCLYTLEELVNENNLNVTFPKEFEFEMNKYNMDKLNNNNNNVYYYYNYHPMISYNARLCQISKNIQNIANIPSIIKLKNKVDIQDSFSLANTFLKEYDENIYEYFKYIVNSKRTFLGTVDCPGLTLYANYITEPYIIVQPSYSIDDALTIVHETIHAYLMNKQRYFCDVEDALYEVNNLHEVYSIFSELVFSRYLADHKIFNEDLIECIKANIASLYNQLTIFESSKYTAYEEERYLYGQILAYHFYNQYMINKNEAKTNILNFMLDAKENEKKYMLNHYGLNSDNILNGKKLVRYINRHLERLDR